MAEDEPLQGEYVEVSSERFQRLIAYQRRWRLHIFMAIGLIIIFIAILLVMILSPKELRPEFNNTQVGTTPLLTLSFPLKDRNHRKGRFNFTIQPDMVSGWMSEAREKLRSRKAIERRLFLDQVNRTDQNPASYHQQVTTLSSEMGNMSDSAVVAEAAVRLLLNRWEIPVEELESVDASPLLKEWVHCDQQNVEIRCVPGAKFRSLDGSCNNLRSPMQGAAMQPFRRILPPAYHDGFSLPRTKSAMRSDHSLPSSREISRSFTDNAPPVANEKKLSMLFLTWGQFVDHDMTNTGSTKGENGTTILCCGQKTDVNHPECFPILINPADKFYVDKGVKCLDFVRSAPAPQCKLNGREQFNQASAYIDGSMIYGGSHLEAEIRLRTHFNGNLRGRLNPDGRWMLPIAPAPNDGCNRDKFMNQSRYCFKAGDPRVNEQFGLTAMHTIWMREHNRISSALIDLNKHWTDARAYEEARKIVGAQVQHITYNEYLPLLLGEKLTEHLKLRPLKHGYDVSYNKEVDAGISNEFATAAYRFGHSMLQGLVELHGAGGRNIDYMQFFKILFNPFILWEFGGLDAVLRGSANQCPKKLNTFFSTQVTNRLFQSEKLSYGLDLYAINIQRGRDHGLAPYHQWREVCNLPPIKDWSDLERDMRPSSLVVLKQLYIDIKDIDLYVGILSENPLPDGILGPVGSCIIADQFVRSKIGDRFWYETNDENVRFTRDQLNEIRKANLARVMCNNGDAIHDIHLRPMETPSETNPSKRCSGNEIPTIDLSYWEDTGLLYV